MKETGARLAVLALFLMLAVGCGSSNDDETVGGTGGANVGNIGQVEVGMTEQQVVDLLGEDMGTSEYEYTGENGLIYRSEDNRPIMVWFKDGKVSRVQTTEGTSDSPWNSDE